MQLLQMFLKVFIMKIPCLAIAFSFLCSFGVSAQIGIVGSFQTFKAGDWEKLILQDLPNQSGLYPIYGFGIGIDYWFRLKKRRIEFTPELSYSHLDGSFDGITAKHDLLSFFFFTNVYPFDLASDCDCPVWSKEGNFFSRGFFLQLAPGASYLHSDTSEKDIFPDAGNNLILGGAIGAGLDLGLSDFLTVTPVARFYFYPKATWDNTAAPGNADTNIQQFFAGLKISFRWDRGKGFRR